MTQKMIRFLPRLGKLLLMISVMVLSMIYFIASINEAKAATLKTSVTVTGDDITLGDVFADLKNNANAQFVLAPAPIPNQTLTWDARTIKRLVNAFDLEYRVSMADQVRINRMATIIKADDVKKAIKASLSQDFNSDHIDLEFVGYDAQIILPHTLGNDLEVLQSSYNPTRKSFSATIKTSDDKVRNYSGIAHNLIEVPVLKHAIRRGDIISRNKIEMTSIREDQIDDHMVLSLDELVGMTPRKLIQPSTPITLTQLDKPIMVERGDLVTMQLHNGPIAITAIAKAMESGAKGDIIRFMNMDSKRTLEAQVTNLREARIFN